MYTPCKPMFYGTPQPVYNIIFSIVSTPQPLYNTILFTKKKNKQGDYYRFR